MEKEKNLSLPPALCWPGGKTKLKNRIISKIPEHKTYIEPFVGGGSVFFKKPLVEKNVINDKNKELIGFYKNLRDGNCKKLQECDIPTNEKEFEKAKVNRKRSVCGFLGVNKRSYACDMKNPKFCKAQSLPKNNPKGGKIKFMKNACNRYQQKLKKTKILNQDYKTVIKKHDNKDSFIYLDPPFYESRKYSAGKVDPNEICDIVKKAKGKVMMSYNNHPEVRKACKGLKIKKVETNYEVQKATTGEGRKVKELLITNY